MAETVKRSAFQMLLNVAPGAAANYALMGDGITSGTINYQPQTNDEVFIHQDSGSTEVESYKPQFPVEAICKKGDEVFDFVDGLRRSRAVLDAAKTDVVIVYLYETPVAGAYPAENQNVSVAIESFGGDGGTSNRIGYTLNFVGDPVTGTFDPTTGTFTPA